MEVGIVSSNRPHSSISGIARPAAPDEPRSIAFSELTRYDLLLAAIAFALVAAWVAGHLAAVPAWAALSVGALAALPALVDGLAVNPPVGPN